MTLTPLPRRLPAVAAFLALAALFALAGCAELTSRPTSGGLAAGSPYTWAAESVEATGAGAAPSSIDAEPQRSLAGKLKAKRAALGALKQRVGRLPVNHENTLGSVMDANIGVRRSVETYLDTAEVVSEVETAPGTWEVRVRARLAPVARILTENFITPDDVPPPRGGEEELPPVT
jgi:hypothetical protein